MSVRTKEYRPRRVRSDEERSTGSAGYIQLDAGEKFVGYALFHADPKEDEAGYYEYMEHYDPALGKKGGSFPCAAEGCPYCEDGDRPRTRAKTLWLVTQHNDKKLKEPEVRTFNMSYPSIMQFVEMRTEGDPIYGQLFRVTRLDDRGNYTYTRRELKLKVGEIKEALKDAPDFEKNLISQGKKIVERLVMQRVMDDDEGEEGTVPTPDDEEGEEATPKARGKSSKAAAKAEPEEEEVDMPDEAEGETLTVVKVTTKGSKANTLVVSHGSYGEFTLWGTEDIDLTGFSVDDAIVASWEKDEEGDYVIQADPEQVSGGAAGELPDLIEDEVFVITEVRADDEQIDVENDELGLEFTLWFLGNDKYEEEVSFDDYEVGMKVKVNAEKDSQGDMVATTVPEPIKATTAKGGKATKRKVGAR